MIDMRVINIDAKSYLLRLPEKCLVTSEQENERKYFYSCLQQLQHFYPFVVSIGGMLSVEDKDTLKRLACRLSTKWKQTYSQKCGYVWSRLAITLVNTTHHCIWGSRVSARQVSIHRPHWEDGVGHSLHR